MKKMPIIERKNESTYQQETPTYLHGAIFDCFDDDSDDVFR